MKNVIRLAVLAMVIFGFGLYIGHISAMRSECFTAFRSGEHIKFFVDRSAPQWAEKEISKAIMSHSIQK